MIKVLITLIVSSIGGSCLASGDAGILHPHELPLEKRSMMHRKHSELSKTALESLSTEDFFDLENKSEEYSIKRDFRNAALYVMACACNTDMGEGYQNIIYNINPLTIEWISSKRIDFEKLSGILPELEAYLEKISKKKRINIEEHFSNKPLNIMQFEQSISFNIIK